MNSNTLVRNLDTKYFFGFAKEGKFYLPYSDLEKTLIDMVVFNQKMSGDVLKNVKRRLNKKKLNDYLEKYSLAIRNRVKAKIS